MKRSLPPEAGEVPAGVVTPNVDTRESPQGWWRGIDVADTTVNAAAAAVPKVTDVAPVKPCRDRHDRPTYRITWLGDIAVTAGTLAAATYTNLLWSWRSIHPPQ